MADTDIDCIVVWQPWATLIACGAKPYEFRGWQPPRRLIGKRLAIAAGARPVKISEVRALIDALEGKSGTEQPCLHHDIALPLLERVYASLRESPDTLFATKEALTLPLGHVICTVTVGAPKRGDICAREFGINAGNDSDRSGHFNWGWPMRDVQPVVPPKPIRGAQGLFKIPARLIEAGTF